MKTNRLQRLSDKLHEAEQKVIHEMRRLWPVDTEIKFMLFRGQQNPTTGRVIGHFEEHVSVTLKGKNRRGYHTTKRVWWRQILP